MTSTNLKVQSVVRVDQVEEYIDILEDRVNQLNKLQKMYDEKVREISREIDKKRKDKKETKDDFKQMKTSSALQEQARKNYNIGNKLLSDIREGLPISGELYNEQKFRNAVFGFITFMNETNTIGNLPHTRHVAGDKAKFDQTITFEDYKALI